MELSDGVVLHHVDAGPARPLPKSEIDQHIDEFRTNMAELGPFDVLHSHHWMSGVAALPVARARGIGHVMTFHSIAANPDAPLRDGEPPESPARLVGEVTCAQESDLVVAVSHYEAAVVIGRCGGDPARVRIIQPGVDTDLFRSATTTWTPEGVRPGYALFAARLQPLKGPDVAIQALARVTAELRPDLVIVGEASADFAGYESELHAMVTELDLADRVHFLPGQDRESLARIIRHASVMLVPSHSETFGLVALEASASGIPVLAAAAGGLTEAICNTHTGQLVPGHDPELWGTYLTQLLADPQRAQQYAITGRQRAVRMSWDRVAERMLAAYRHVIDGTIRA